MPCVTKISFLEAQCIVSKKLEALSPLISKAYFRVGQDQSFDKLTKPL